MVRIGRIIANVARWTLMSATERIELTISLGRGQGLPQDVRVDYYQQGRLLGVPSARGRVDPLIEQLYMSLIAGDSAALGGWLTGRGQFRTGRALFELLFPDSGCLGTLLDALRLDRRDGLSRHAFRVRIATEVEQWAGLPWSLTMSGHQRLGDADNNWIFENVHDVAPMRSVAGYRGVPRILVWAPTDSFAGMDEHLARLQGLLAHHNALYDRPEHFTVATNFTTLRKICRGGRADLIYLLGRVEFAPVPRLVSPGEAPLSFTDLRPILAQAEPMVVFVNGNHAGAPLAHSAGRQFAEQFSAVVAPCAQMLPETAMALAERWFEEHVIAGYPPVDSLYRVRPSESVGRYEWALPVAFTRYGTWLTRPVGQLRPCLSVRLDRFNQRAHVARKVKELLFQAQDRRIQLLVAAGEPGNLVEGLCAHVCQDLTATEPDYQIMRWDLTLPADRDALEPSGDEWTERDLARGRTKLEQILIDVLAVGDDIPLLDAIGYAFANRYPGKTPLLWLDWGAYGDRRGLQYDERSSLRADCPSDTLELWLDFHRALARHLAHRVDIKIVASIALEKPPDVLPYLEEDIVAFANEGHDHIAAHALPALQSVQRHELMEFLRDDPSTGVPRQHLARVTDLLMESTSGDYQELVRIIAQGERSGWREFVAKDSRPPGRRKY